MNPLSLLLVLACILIVYAIIIPSILLLSSHLAMRQRQRNALLAFTHYRNSSNP